MSIYFIQLEAIPQNPEKEECLGAFVNCWVKSINIKLALYKAKKYMSNQGWEVISIEEQCIVNRDMYEGKTKDDKELLKCFDEAVGFGMSAYFYTWTSEDDE